MRLFLNKYTQAPHSILSFLLQFNRIEEKDRKAQKLSQGATKKLNVFVASRDNYKSFHSFHFKQLDIVRDMYQCCQCFLYICITSVC